MNVLIVGRGKVGSSIAREAKKMGHHVETRSGRHFSFSKTHANLVLLAVRDASLEETARALAERGTFRKGTVVALVSGSARLSVLDPFTRKGLYVGRLHPVASFVSRKTSPPLEGAYALIEGNKRSRARLQQLARSLGLQPFSRPKLGESPGYHAALAIVANGAATLATIAMHLLTETGIAQGTAEALLGELLRTVASNVRHEGLPMALSGPVRRGDAMVTARQLAVLSRPDEKALVAASILLQCALARTLGDAREEDLTHIVKNARQALAASLKKGL